MLTHQILVGHMTSNQHHCIMHMTSNQHLIGVDFCFVLLNGHWIGVNGLRTRYRLQNAPLKVWKYLKYKMYLVVWSRNETNSHMGERTGRMDREKGERTSRRDKNRVRTDVAKGQKSRPNGHGEGTKIAGERPLDRTDRIPAMSDAGHWTEAVAVRSGLPGCVQCATYQSAPRQPINHG